MTEARAVMAGGPTATIVNGKGQVKASPKQIFDRFVSAILKNVWEYTSLMLIHYITRFVNGFLLRNKQHDTR